MNACVHKAVCVLDMIGKEKNLETGNLQGEQFSFLFFFQKESLWSPVCFFFLQTGRRGEAEEAGSGRVLGARE